jgi:hypothetical protein
LPTPSLPSGARPASTHCKLVGDEDIAGEGIYMSHNQPNPLDMREDRCHFTNHVNLLSTSRGSSSWWIESTNEASLSPSTVENERKSLSSILSYKLDKSIPAKPRTELYLSHRERGISERLGSPRSLPMVCPLRSWQRQHTRMSRISSAAFSGDIRPSQLAVRREDESRDA